MGLVQLCQTAPASGGYSDSFGIASLARSGKLATPTQLASMVRTVLVESIGPADGVASGVAFRAARRGAFEELPGLCAVLNSERLPLPMQIASLQMGQRLWGLSRKWEWADGVHQQLDPRTGPGDLHHAVAFGTLVSETTASQIRAIATYLLNTARGLIAAAVQAIPLDEIVGLRVLNDVQPTITELAQACADRPPEQIAVVRPYFP